MYRLMRNGKIICSGISGTLIMAILSLGTPTSINFKEVTASQAAKPT